MLSSRFMASSNVIGWSESPRPFRFGLRVVFGMAGVYPTRSTVVRTMTRVGIEMSPRPQGRMLPLRSPEICGTRTVALFSVETSQPTDLQETGVAAVFSITSSGCHSSPE